MKGYITVYLALVTGILLSIFLTVIGAARRDLIRLQTECCTDMAMQSALAQYHQEMLSRYGLFFVDTSYGTGEPDYHKTENMIRSYLEKNLAPEKTFAVSGAGNLTGLSAEAVQLLQAGNAADENFGVLKYHVVQYMKDCYGISAAQGLLALGEQLAGSGYVGDGIEQEWDAAQTQLTEEIRSGKKLQDQNWDGNIPETPSDAVQATRGEGILTRVVKKKSLSSKTVSAQTLVSGRKRNQGTGLAAGKEIPDSVWENSLLYAYILEKCGFYGAEKENGALDYQVEYILQRQESDVENLRKTAQQLLWIREASNAAFLFSSSLKQPAETTALIITGILGLPELTELMTTVILFAWSYAESVKDVRILLSGGKVPLVKSQESWNTSFAQLLTYRAHLDDWKEAESGFEYRDYLGALLFLKGADEVMPGLADIMEGDIRKTAGNEKFRIDGLIDGMQVLISVSSSYGGNWQITREYDYE